MNQLAKSDSGFSQTSCHFCYSLHASLYPIDFYHLPIFLCISTNSLLEIFLLYSSCSKWGLSILFFISINLIVNCLIVFICSTNIFTNYYIGQYSNFLLFSYRSRFFLALWYFISHYSCQYHTISTPTLFEIIILLHWLWVALLIRKGLALFLIAPWLGHKEVVIFSL